MIPKISRSVIPNDYRHQLAMSIVPYFQGRHDANKTARGMNRQIMRDFFHYGRLWRLWRDGKPLR